MGSLGESACMAQGDDCPYTHEMYEGQISRHAISVAITESSVSAARRKELRAACVCVCVWIGIALGPYSHWCWLGLLLIGWVDDGFQALWLHICRSCLWPLALPVWSSVPLWAVWLSIRPSHCRSQVRRPGNDAVIFCWRGVSVRGVPRVIWKSLQRCLFNHYEWPSAEPWLSVWLWLCGCVSQCGHVCRLHEGISLHLYLFLSWFRWISFFILFVFISYDLGLSLFLQHIKLTK